MKKISTIVFLMLFCFLFTACTAIEALQYTISGDIIDPAEGFSCGEENTLIYQNNKYILVSELGGSCEIDVTEDDILLGQRSNFPFFPNSYYYANPDENPRFIMGGTDGTGQGSFVYLREDLYGDAIVYESLDGSFEFEFRSELLQTDAVDYDHHVARKQYTSSAMLEFCIKEIPTVTAHKRIYLIEEIWYCIDADGAYRLSDEFVGELTAAGILGVAH